MNKKSTIYLMTTCAIFSALMCICGPMSIPIGLVPVSLTNLVLYAAIFLLGTKGTVISYIVYLLLGTFGLPVFSGGQGGIGKLAGPTGGYLIGFIFMVLVMGVIAEKNQFKVVPTYIGMVIATAIAYAFGSVWFMVSRQVGLMATLSTCVFPFIPFDLIKMAAAIVVGREVRAALKKASLLPDFKNVKLAD